jgi:hypothetical protein
LGGTKGSGFKGSGFWVQGSKVPVFALASYAAAGWVQGSKVPVFALASYAAAGWVQRFKGSRLRSGELRRGRLGYSILDLGPPSSCETSAFVKTTARQDGAVKFRILDFTARSHTRSRLRIE